MTRRSTGAEENMNQRLFEDLAVPGDAEHGKSPGSERSQGALRVLEPNRAQVQLRASDLESLAHDHHARLVWSDVERQN